MIHSHPGGLFAFSDIDDASDRRVIPGLFHAHGDLHGSAIMTPDGAIRARLYSAEQARDGRSTWSRSSETISATGGGLVPGSPGLRLTLMAFTSAMTAWLGHLTAVVIEDAPGPGRSWRNSSPGWDSLVVISIDFDHVERRNLNRILNARLSDAEDRRLKVTMFVEAIEGYRGAGVGQPVAASLLTREAVLAASQGDVIFCCVDTLEARQGRRSRVRGLP